MSLSRDGTKLTTRSPIRTTPDEISSRPATIRSAVVLPHPDGPTRTMNSPSSIPSWSSLTAVVPSAYTLLTRSNSTAAIHPSLLPRGILSLLSPQRKSVRAQRQRHTERRTAAGTIFDPGPAALQRRELRDEREADSRAGHVGRA